MDLRRLRFGEWLAAAAGAGLIAALLLPWYEVPRATSVSGYEALTVIDVLLTPLALLALALAVAQLTRDTPALPVALGVLTAVLGKFGVLLVLFRLIDSPNDGYEVSYGAWVALIAALAITAAGWLSLAAEHVRGLPRGPEPDLRRAPAPS